MEKAFDRKYFNANVPLLIEKKGLRVGALEAKIGLSTGYISRICKEDNSTKISADLLAALSAELEVSMDLLGCCDLGGLTPRAQSMALFCEKLTEETLFADRSWDRDSFASIDDAERHFDGKTSHPLFHHDGDDLYFNSHFAREQGTKVKSDIYHTLLEEGTHLYIACVTYPGNENRLDYELYICQEDYSEWVTSAVCASDPLMPSPLDPILKRLYSSIAETNRQVQCSSFVKGVIDRFMAPKPAEDGTLSADSASENDPF